MCFHRSFVQPFRMLHPDQLRRCRVRWPGPGPKLRMHMVDSQGLWQRSLYSIVNQQQDGNKSYHSDGMWWNCVFCSIFLGATIVINQQTEPTCMGLSHDVLSQVFTTKKKMHLNLKFSWINYFDHSYPSLRHTQFWYWFLNISTSKSDALRFRFCRMYCWLWRICLFQTDWNSWISLSMFWVPRSCFLGKPVLVTQDEQRPVHPQWWGLWLCGPFFVEFQCTLKLLFVGDIPPLVQHDQDNSDLSPKLVELKGTSAENSTCGCRNHVFNCNQATLN